MKHRDIWTKISFYSAYKVADTPACSWEILTKQLIMMCVGMYIKRDRVISISVTLKNTQFSAIMGNWKQKNMAETAKAASALDFFYFQHVSKLVTHDRKSWFLAKSGLFPHFCVQYLTCHFFWPKRWPQRELKLYPRKWTRDFDPWPRSADTHLTHRVRSAAPVLW